MSGRPWTDEDRELAVFLRLELDLPVWAIGRIFDRTEGSMQDSLLGWGVRRSDIHKGRGRFSAMMELDIWTNGWSARCAAARERVDA